MKRSVAAWLLVGLSLGVPQFCKGEATAPGAGCGTGRESPGKRCAGGWRRYPGRSRGGERRGRHRGGCALPCVPRKSARKVREEYAGLSREEGVGYTQMRSRKDGDAGEAGGKTDLSRLTWPPGSHANPPWAVWVMPAPGSRRGFCWGAREASVPREWRSGKGKSALGLSASRVLWSGARPTPSSLQIRTRCWEFGRWVRWRRV